MAKQDSKHDNVCLETLDRATKEKNRPEEFEALVELVNEARREIENSMPDVYPNLSIGAKAEMIVNVTRKKALKIAGSTRRRAALTVNAKARIDRELNWIYASGKRGFSACQELLERVSRRVKASQDLSVSRFLKVFEGKKVPSADGFGFFEDKNFSRAFIRAIYGEPFESGKYGSLVKDAAKAFSEEADLLRQRFNLLGGEMRKLDHYFPQTHNINRMQHAAEILRGEGRLKQMTNTVRNTFEEGGGKLLANREAWANFVFDRLDLNRYKSVFIEAGGDFELGKSRLLKILEEMFDTIITDGDVGVDVSTVAGKAARRGSRIQRGELHRRIHFKNADAFEEYREKFGTGDLITTAVNGLRRMAKDVSLLEEFGASPNATVAGIRRIAEADVKQQNLIQGVLKAPRWPDLFDAMWDTLNGDSTSIAPGRQIFANAMQGFRNAEVFGKLQSTLINSISDIATYFIEAHLFRIPASTAAYNLFTAFSKEHRDLLVRGGLMADTIARNFVVWGENSMGKGWTSMLSNGVMKASGLDHFTRAVRQAQMINLMGAMAEITKHEWKDVPPFLLKQLERAGVDETTWRIWGKAQRTNVRGADFLDAQSIIDLQQQSLGTPLGGLSTNDFERAASSYVAFLTNEGYFASLQPDLFTRAATNMGFQKGTIPGELARSFMLFKGFPVGFTMRHLERIRDLYHTEGGWSATGYGASVFVLSTIFGAFSVQINELLNGRDPQKMKSLDFVLQAMSRGGGAGFLCDVIVSGLDGQNAYGGQNWLRLMGPVFGTTFDTADAVKAWINQGLYDKESSAAKKTISLIRGHMPFVNLWYAKGVIDRAVYNEIMETVSPGYMDRIRRFQMKYKGVGYYAPQDRLEITRSPRWENTLK